MNGPGLRPRAIYFDVGETLIRARQPYGELLAEIAQEPGITLPTEVTDGLAARIDARVAMRTRLAQPFTFPAAESQRFWMETYHDFFGSYLPAADALLLAHAFLNHLSSPAGYELFEDTMSALMRLSEDGYHLGIISNWEAWLPALLDATGIAPFFKHIVISGTYGAEKPDSRIFTLALDKGGYRSEEVVYVGDRPAHDVAPALTVGIVPILLDRTDRFSANLMHHRIASLTELPAVLSSRRLNVAIDLTS